MVAVLEIEWVIITRPPAHHPSRGGRARTLTGATGIVDFSDFVCTERATECFDFVHQANERCASAIGANKKIIRSRKDRRVSERG
jgi:hypothetical protein